MCLCLYWPLFCVCVCYNAKLNKSAMKNCHTTRPDLLVLIWKVILDKNSSSRIDVFHQNIGEKNELNAPFWIVYALSRIDDWLSWTDRLGPVILDRSTRIGLSSSLRIGHRLSHACTGSAWIDRGGRGGSSKCHYILSYNIGPFYISHWRIFTSSLTFAVCVCACVCLCVTIFTSWQMYDWTATNNAAYSYP